MFDLKVYEKTLEKRELSLSEYYDNNILDYALACDTEANKAAAVFSLWKEDHAKELDKFRGNDCWFNAKIDLASHLENLYYNFGWYCYFHKIPINDIDFISFEALQKDKDFVHLYKAYTTQENALLFDSKKEKTLFNTYCKMEKLYLNALLLALARLGYYHCQTDIIKMQQMFKDTVSKN